MVQALRCVISSAQNPPALHLSRVRQLRFRLCYLGPFHLSVFFLIQLMVSPWKGRFLSSKKAPSPSQSDSLPAGPTPSFTQCASCGQKSGACGRGLFFAPRRSTVALIFIQTSVSLELQLPNFSYLLPVFLAKIQLLHRPLSDFRARTPLNAIFCQATL